jgi:hypothetical protein
VTETETGAETRRTTIGYHGRGSGCGPLTLGQDNMIRCILHDEPSEINKQIVFPVPDGVGLEAALDALRVLAERHESLRTVFPGPPGEQPDRQEVRADGEFEVEIVAATPDQDPDAVADGIGRRNRAVRFDLAAEFPLRLALVTVSGRPVRLVVVVCHAAADGGATGLLLQEWTELVTGHGLEPPSGPTPRQIAEQERSAAGRRRAKAALRHWERILREAPFAVFADSSLGPSAGLLPTLVVRSGSAAGSLDAAARRTGASPSSIMLAAFAALVAHRAAQREIVVAALSANRNRAALRQYVGTLAQDALISLETAAPDFDALIAKSGAAAMAGYWNSTFDGELVWRLIDDVAQRRGARFARHLVFNDLSGTIPEAAVRNRPAPPEDPQFTWLPAEYVPTRLMLNIWRLRDCVELTLMADPQLFGRAEAEQFAHGLLALVRAAADGPVPLEDLSALTGITPGRRDGGWLLTGGSWVDPAAVRALLQVALDKRPVGLFVQGGTLTARIAENGRPITPEDAHRAVMDVLCHQARPAIPVGAGTSSGPEDDAADGNSADSSALSGWETAMAPHRYVIHSGTPRAAEEQEAWTELPVIAQGDGRVPPETDWASLLA